MPGERVSMRKIREVLRLRFAQGLSQRAIGVSLGVSTGAVNSYLGRARMVGLNWPLADEFSDAGLETFYIRRHRNSRRSGGRFRTGRWSIASCDGRT